MARAAERVRAEPAPQRTETQAPTPAFPHQISSTYWSRHMDTTTLGGRMTIQREHLGLRQDQVAELIGVARTAYSQYETRTVVPNLAKIIALAEALQTTPEWLAFGVGERSSMPELTYDVPSKSWTQVNVCALNPQWLKQHLPNIDLKTLCTVRLPDAVAGMNADDIAIVQRDVKVTDKRQEFLYVMGADILVGDLQRTKEGIEVFMGKASEKVHPRNLKVLGLVVGHISLGA